MNYEEWAEWYDIFYSTTSGDEVEFYLDLAQRCGGPVLEIGVGTGRIGLPAVKEGIEWVGIDLHQPMLDRAHAKALEMEPLQGSLQLIRGDMRSLDLGERRFPLVIIPANTLLLAITERGQVAALECAAHHLKPEGLLVFNAYRPDPDVIYSNSEEPILLGKVLDPETGHTLSLTGINHFDVPGQINRGVQSVEEIDTNGNVLRTQTLEVVTRFIYPHEAHRMIEDAGMRVTAQYGSFDRSPLTEDSPEMIFECELVAG